MLFHVSIEADQPRHVAEVIAEFWRGRALPFPPVAEGSWIAMAGDDRGSAIEVYPRGTQLHEGPGGGDAVGLAGDRHEFGATHLALATVLTIEEVFAIATREGWPVKRCRRGGAFDVIELWIEGVQMVELLTAEMVAEYREMLTIENWERALAGAQKAMAAA